MVWIDGSFHVSSCFLGLVSMVLETLSSDVSLCISVRVTARRDGFGRVTARRDGFGRVTARKKKENPVEFSGHMNFTGT